jgi:hypothetical protein
MIKVILYSESDENIKKIQALLESREESSMEVKKISQSGKDDKALDSAGLLILDLSGLSINSGNFKNEIKKINGLSADPVRGRLLIIDPSQQAYLFDELLFANDFLFINNLKKELLPRIDFLLYKLKLMVPADSLVIGDMVLNMEKYELVIDNRIVVLTFKEFEMLKLLMQNKDKVFTRINLLSTVWGYDYYGGSRTVDVHMRRLRAKIPPPYNNMLKTIRNVGYMFSPEE